MVMDTRERAKVLLGSGQPALVVAQAIGVDHSRIAQLLAEPEFAKEVAELRFKNLQDQAARDQKYDGVEDTLIGKLQDSLEYIVKPMEIVRALKEVNSMKRRGVLDPTAGQQFNTVVQLQLPTAVKAKFTIDATGIIVSVGERPMVTMPANVLLKEIEGERVDGKGDAGKEDSFGSNRLIERQREISNLGLPTPGSRERAEPIGSDFLRTAEAEIAALGI